MTRSDFREKWGPQWAALIASPMWLDAMAAADAEIGIFRVASMTDEEIEKHGPLIVKGMQSHTKLEAVLTTLAEKPFEFAQIEPTYPDPVVEAHQIANPPKKPRKKKSP